MIALAFVILGSIVLIVLFLMAVGVARGLNYNRNACSHKESRAAAASAEHKEWRVGQVDSHWEGLRKRPERKLKKIEGKSEPEGTGVISAYIRWRRQRIKAKASLLKNMHERESRRIERGRTGQRVHPVHGHTTHGVRREGFGSEGLLNKLKLHHTAYPKPAAPRPSKPSVVHRIIVGKPKKE